LPSERSRWDYGMVSSIICWSGLIYWKDWPWRNGAWFVFISWNLKFWFSVSLWCWSRSGDAL
jgi:hypothetical protein